MVHEERWCLDISITTFVLDASFAAIRIPGQAREVLEVHDVASAELDALARAAPLLLRAEPEERGRVLSNTKQVVIPPPQQSRRNT